MGLNIGVKLYQMNAFFTVIPFFALLVSPRIKRGDSSGGWESEIGILLPKEGGYMLVG